LDQSQTIQLYQPLLQDIAYRLLKCKADAEDIVQDTFVKWLHIEQSNIENTKAYLIKAVTNNCLNHLGTLRKKKEEYWDHIRLSGWVKKIKEADINHLDIELELKDAFNYLNQKLEPLERAVYLLKEVFDMDYPTLQQIFDKKADHVRQSLSRAKKKLSSGKVTKVSSLNTPPTILESFKKACQIGPAANFIEELKQDVLQQLKKY
jgi:RNA polymerase sigma factor (sigma-70 family)